MKIEVKHGVYFISPYDKNFAEDKLKAFVMRTRYDIENQAVYLCSGAKVQGIIYIEEIREISIDEFRELQSEHLTPDIVRHIRWGSQKLLYFYKFRKLKLYDKPRKYNYVPGKHAFIENLEIANEE